VTENFVPTKHLATVLKFFRDRSDQISGFKGDVTDAYRLFVERLKQAYPDELQRALETFNNEGYKRQKNRTKPTKWEQLRDAGKSGFSFGFIDMEDGEEEAS